MFTLENSGKWVYSAGATRMKTGVDFGTAQLSDTNEILKNEIAKRKNVEEKLL